MQGVHKITALIFHPFLIHAIKLFLTTKNVKLATTENILSSFQGLAGQITRFDLSNHFCIFLTHNSIPSIKPSTLLKTLEQLDFVQCFIGGRSNKKLPPEFSSQMTCERCLVEVDSRFLY